MAGSKISDYAVGGNNWTELLETIEKQRKGFIGISLTNYDNSSLPAIASGSYIEISGALYGFTSDEAISGSATSSSINYIYIDPTTVTASWTTTAPTWSTAKNGWYDAGQSYRYIGECHYDGTNYRGKTVYPSQRGRLTRVLPIGDWNMNVSGAGTDHVDVAHYISDVEKIRSIEARIFKDPDASAAISPNEDLTGGYSGGTSENGNIHISGNDSTVIKLYVVPGGYFDSTNFDATSFNRGFVTIWYEA